MDESKMLLNAIRSYQKPYRGITKKKIPRSIAKHKIYWLVPSIFSYLKKKKSRRLPSTSNHTSVRVRANEGESYAWFQASAAKQMTIVLFWVIT
jgi:hypothetical protein